MKTDDLPELAGILRKAHRGDPAAMEALRSIFVESGEDLGNLVMELFAWRMLRADYMRLRELREGLRTVGRALQADAFESVHPETLRAAGLDKDLFCGD